MADSFAGNFADAWAQRGLVQLLQGNEAAAQNDFAQRLLLNNRLKQSLEEQIRAMHAALGRVKEHR